MGDKDPRPEVRGVIAWLRVLPCRLWLYVRIVGREWHSRLGPVLAWQIVARVHPVRR
jgi:hypothetical protein